VPRQKSTSKDPLAERIFRGPARLTMGAVLATLVLLLGVAALLGRDDPARTAAPPGRRLA